MNPRKVHLRRADRVLSRNITIPSEKENFPDTGDLLPGRRQHSSLQRTRAPLATEWNTPNGISNPQREVLRLKEQRLNIIRQHPISRHVIKADFFQDEDWIEQQQRLFTSVLNEAFRKKLSPEKLREFSSTERKLAFNYYQSDDFQQIRRRLSAGLKSRRLCVIDSKSPYQDVGIRAAITNLFCENFSETWLSLALEVVTGREYGVPEYGNKKTRSFLQNFILDYALDEAKAGIGGTVIDSTLKLFLIVYLLDHLVRVLTGPCLFQTSSRLKSSSDFARELGHLCLRGQGDVVRGLHFITKSELRHIQFPLDDFQYEIQNLAIDFRDGIRLTKLCELLSGNNGYSHQLRSPVNSSSQRCHNLSIAFSALEAEGINMRYNGMPLTIQDIEIGNREKTLFVLWELISHWLLPEYLDGVDLGGEIQLLKKLVSCRNLSVRQTEVEALFDNKRLNDLLEWAALVSALCSKPLDNFISSCAQNEHFRNILAYYFPKSAPSLEELLRGHFHTLLASNSCGIARFLNIRVNVTGLAILASRVVVNNDIRKAAIKIQRKYRDHLRTKMAVPPNSQITIAAIRIQRAYKRHLLRKRRHLSVMIALQARIRGLLFRARWKREALQRALRGQGRIYYIR